MRLTCLLGLLLIFSCHQPQETILPPPKPDPWTYINRISETLEEMEFSIYNSFDKNLDLAKKNNLKSLLKYRIGQNKYLKLVLSSVELYDAVGVILDYDNSCQVQFGHKNHMLIENTFFNADYDNMDSAFFNYIIGTFNEDKYDYPNARFKIYLDRETKQNEVLNVIDELAKGYILFMDYYSELKYKKSFKGLDHKEQSKLMNEIPFEINYDYYRMYHFGKKPEVPKTD